MNFALERAPDVGVGEKVPAREGGGEERGLTGCPAALWRLSWARSLWAPP